MRSAAVVGVRQRAPDLNAPRARVQMPQRGGSAAVWPVVVVLCVLSQPATGLVDPVELCFSFSPADCPTREGFAFCDVTQLQQEKLQAALATDLDLQAQDVDLNLGRCRQWNRCPSDTCALWVATPEAQRWRVEICQRDSSACYTAASMGLTPIVDAPEDEEEFSLTLLVGVLVAVVVLSCSAIALSVRWRRRQLKNAVMADAATDCETVEVNSISQSTAEDRYCNLVSMDHCESLNDLPKETDSASFRPVRRQAGDRGVVGLRSSSFDGTTFENGELAERKLPAKWIDTTSPASGPRSVLPTGSARRPDPPLKLIPSDSLHRPPLHDTSGSGMPSRPQSFRHRAAGAHTSTTAPPRRSSPHLSAARMSPPLP